MFVMFLNVGANSFARGGMYEMVVRMNSHLHFLLRF